MPKTVIHYLLFFLGSITVFSLHGQELSEFYPEVSRDGSTLLHPWAGGLNAPQFSPVHLDSDSLIDLFVFERSGNMVLTFVGRGEHIFEFDDSYISSFPPLRDWAILRDYNQDGVQDIFSYSTTGAPGFDVYRGSIGGGLLSYQKLTFPTDLQVLTYPLSSGGRANIYISNQDIPEVVDVDKDGDLDILSFDVDGTRLRYYRNMAIEKDLGSDTLDYILEDRCWGKFTESFNTNQVILSNDANACASGVAPRNIHSGSTIAAFDWDFDEDLDLLLGDISFDDLLLLINGGSNEQAFITGQMMSFPNDQDPVILKYFPAAFMIDLNADSIQDFVATPTQLDARQNVEMTWLYSGVKGETNVEFELTRKDFLTDQMLDFGTDATPLFFDFNSDGLTDILVGSRFHRNHDPNQPSTLFLLENTGSLEEPKFEIRDTNYLRLSQHVNELDALTPTSYDIDHDGDEDLIIGNKTGKLILVENVAGPNQEFVAGTIEYPWFDIDVGFGSFPAIFDVDGDSLPDLIVGEERGNVNFLRNVGTVSQPSYNPDLDDRENRDEFGFIDTRQSITVFGIATPTVLHTLDSTFLVCGSSAGEFSIYPLDASGLNDTLPKLESSLSELYVGRRLRGSFADINGDGWLDLVTGNARGGLTIFSTSFRTTQIVSDLHLAQPQPRVYPNPFKDNLTIDWNQTINYVQIFDLQGRLIFRKAVNAKKLELDLAELSPGLYQAKIISAGYQYVKRLVKF